MILFNYITTPKWQSYIYSSHRNFYKFAIGNINFVIIPLIGGALLAAGEPQVTMLINAIMMIVEGVLMCAGKLIRPGQELESIIGE